MTRPSPDHRRWRAEVAAHLLSSLEPDETEALERHLEGCERCRAEIRWLQPAIDMLPESVPQLDPPPQLRERLMAEARTDATAVALREDEATVRSERGLRSSHGLLGFLMRPAVGLTAVALIGAVIGGYALRGGGGGAGTTTTHATTVAASGTVKATLERSGDSGTLEMTGLHPLPRSRVYEAWVQRDGRVEPSALFAAGRDGSAGTAISHQLDGAKAVMVTVEPRGGSRQPTGTPILRVALPD